MVPAPCQSAGVQTPIKAIASVFADFGYEEHSHIHDCLKTR
jgi:hypothetical protein